MNTLREQFIERLLREFFQKKGGGFVLKGGGAVRTLFGSQRQTKDVDMDFPNPKRSADSLHNTVNRGIKSAATGLPLQDLRISTPGKGERSPRWKINFRDAHGESFHIEVEISRDPGRIPPGAVVQKPFVPEAAKGIARFWVDIYDVPALIATKLAALLGRSAPRDIYDLDLLIGPSPVPSREQIRWAIKNADLHDQNVTEVLQGQLDTLTWERYQTELRDVLAEAVAERIDEQEWRNMKTRVGDYARRLLQGLKRVRS